MPAEHHGDGRDHSGGAVSFMGVRCIRQTAKAILCVGQTGKERWIPLSAVHDDSPVFEKDQCGTLILKRWWAEKNGLAKRIAE